MRHVTIRYHQRGTSNETHGDIGRDGGPHSRDDRDKRRGGGEPPAAGLDLHDDHAPMLHHVEHPVLHCVEHPGVYDDGRAGNDNGIDTIDFRAANDDLHRAAYQHVYHWGTAIHDNTGRVDINEYRGTNHIDHVDIDYIDLDYYVSAGDFLHDRRSPYHFIELLDLDPTQVRVVNHGRIYRLTADPGPGEGEAAGGVLTPG